MVQFFEHPDTLLLLVITFLQLAYFFGQWRKGDEGNIRTLSEKIRKLETEYADWIGKLRDRTHDHTNHFERLPQELRTHFLDKEVAEIQHAEHERLLGDLRKEISSLWTELEMLKRGRRS